jgi:vancomycin permeability regulator SanA
MNKVQNNFIKIIFSIIIVPLVFPLLICFLFILSRKKGSELIQSDAAIVFGAKVKATGPSYTLLNRTEHAAYLYKKGFCKYILVSGAGNQDEPHAMEKILINNGIPEASIIKDLYGHTTKKTIQNAKKIMNENSWKSVIMVSSKYHLARISVACKKERIKYAGSAPDTIKFAKLNYFYIRETFALLYYLIF